MTAVVLLVGLEVGVYVFYKAGRLGLATRDEIVTISKNVQKETKTLKPIYIPHPYFGYVYTPNNRFFKGNYVASSNDCMKSNSEGFIDEEFPLEKREGLCIYGILGGSAAMSWGVAKREYRLSYQLEKLLNTHLRNNKCRQYRVLNMGIGSHTQYQATQIYLYYKNLLDGVIFYNGFNECAHGAMLTNNDPVRFPVIAVYASLQMPSSLILATSEMRREAVNIAKFLMRHPYLIYSPCVRFLFKRKIQRIETLQKRLQDEGHATTLPSIRGRHKERLKNLFPDVNPMSLLHSYDYDNPDIPKVLDKILPLVYTEPTLNAYTVAKVSNTHFLSVIQPMIYATGKGLDWKGRCVASYHFQKTCVEKLLEEAKKLEPYGIKTYDINEKNFIKKELFYSQVHIKPEGNKIAARYLFELIKKDWHN